MKPPPTLLTIIILFISCYSFSQDTIKTVSFAPQQQLQQRPIDTTVIDSLELGYGGDEYIFSDSGTLIIKRDGCGEEEHNCPEGYSWMPTVATTALIIEANECLPDSVCKKMWIAFHKSICDETSMMAFGEDSEYSSINTWVNDSIGCVTKETYKLKIKGKWKEVSKCRYYYNNKGTSCYTDKKVPCCGHVHKKQPK